MLPSESSDCLGADPIHGDLDDLDEIDRALLAARDGWRFGPGDYVLHMDRHPDCLMLVLSETVGGPRDRAGFKMPYFRVRDTKTGEVSVVASYSLSAPLNEMEVLARMSQ
jgi:hypothetical protein